MDIRVWLGTKARPCADFFMQAIKIYCVRYFPFINSKKAMTFIL